MFDPNTMTLSELVNALKNVGILVTILVAGWKARALVQPIIDFLDDSKRLMQRATRHMDMMEESMSLLLNNHLSHLKHINFEPASYEEYQTSAASEIVAESPADDQEPQV